MTEFDEFLAKQEEIYSRFRNSSIKVEKDGIKPNIPQNQGGYIIALRHPPTIMDVLGEFSSRIAQAVPAIVYDKSNGHTTIFVYGLQNDFIPDEPTLGKLTEGLYRTQKQILPPTINYKEWLYNQDSVIVGGTPDEAFFYISRNIIDAVKKEGIDVRLPWGAHITASRYTQERRPEELAAFLELMRHAPILGESKPFALDVGHFKLSPEGFDLKTCERFLLSR